MPKTTTSFQPGQSGNPKGRPPKERALSRMLENGGKRTVGAGGKTAQMQLVDNIWSALATGRLIFQSGDEIRVVELDGAEWARLAKMVYSQVDGPPPAAIDVTSAGAPLNVMFEIKEGSPGAAKVTTPGEDDEDDDV